MATTETSGTELVVRVFERAWNEGTYDETNFTSDYRAHGITEGPADLAGEREVVAAFRTAFPDLHKHPEDVLADGDRVALRYTMHGTHEGELMGVPASGAEVNATGTYVYRLQDGRIVESWLNYDAMGIMQQIGAIDGQAIK